MPADGIEINECLVAGTFRIIKSVVAVDDTVLHIVDLTRRERVLEIRRHADDFAGISIF